MTAVLIAGGGTGGHLFPGIAVAEELRRRDPSVRLLFVGTARGIEVEAVPKAGFDLELLPVSGLRRTGLGGFVTGIARLPVALAKAIKLIRRFRPDVAISVGGYAAGPAILAAYLLGVCCIVMEQNAVPGLTNQVLSHLARHVVVALRTESVPRSKARVLGNPVRADFLPVRDQAYAPGSPLRLLIFGGSQGARPLNEVMMALAPRLVATGPALHIRHQTGRADAERVRAAYGAAGLENVDVLPFIHDMPAVLASSDLVVCRSGASTIAELTVCGRPSILVPFPQAAGDHQTVNAKTLEEVGAAMHLAQASLTAESLHEALQAFACEPHRLEEMARRAKELGKPQAARDIADLITGELASKEDSRV